MRRVFLFVVLVGAALLLLAFLALGAFPPESHPQEVQHQIPLDKIQAH